jgi:predicted porin
VPVTAAGSLTAQYSKAETNDAADRTSTAINAQGDAQAFSVGYQHNLSKRTALYTTASIIDNDNSNFRVQTNAVAAARGGKSGGLDVGVKHSF